MKWNWKNQMVCITTSQTKSCILIAFAEEVRQLRIQLQMEGLFDSSKFYYAWKLLSNFAILASSIYCLCSYGESSWPLLTLSAVGVGIFWQQSGWLAHDFLHHQVFADRMMNNIFGYILGNIFQGFSVDWWKNKHNTQVLKILLLTDHDVLQPSRSTQHSRI